MDTIEITVSEDFIDHRSDKAKIYNQRGRTDRKFLMDIDAELLEFHRIYETKEWWEHPDWRVDAILPSGANIDVKFISKYWNVSREKTLNLLKQRDMVYGYLFYEWEYRPRRPFRAGDEVKIRPLGFLYYSAVAENLRKSFKEPDGFYLDVRYLLAEKRLHKGV